MPGKKKKNLWVITIWVKNFPKKQIEKENESSSWKDTRDPLCVSACKSKGTGIEVKYTEIMLSKW